MSEWVLLLLLVTGEALPVTVDERTCRGVAAAIGDGTPVLVTLDDGITRQVAKAKCVPPCPICTAPEAGS